MSETVHGVWWFEGLEDNKYSGSLSIDAQGGELVLIDILDGVDDTLVDSCNVYGITDTGNFTLYDGFQIGGNSLGQLCRVRRFRFNWVMKGWINKELLARGLYFDSFTLDWPDLREWFSVTGFQSERGDSLSDFSISYEQPDPIVVSLNNGNEVSFDFYTRSIPFGRVGNDLGNYSETVFVNFKGEQLTPEDCFQFISAMRMFFSICSGRLKEPKKITLNRSYIENEKMRHSDLEVMGESHFECNNNFSFHPLLVPADYNLLADDFSEILSCWLNSYREREAVALNYMLSVYGPKKFIESSFTHLIHAAEALHRKNCDYTLVDRRRFDDEILPKLEAVIGDASLNNEAKNIIKRKLQFLNEKSLKARLVAMYKEIEKVDLLESVDVRDLSQRISDARNYMTHYSEDPKDAPSLDAIAIYTLYLRFLFEIYFLVSIGANPEKLATRYERNNTIGDFVRNAKAFDLLKFKKKKAS